MLFDVAAPSFWGRLVHGALAIGLLPLALAACSTSSDPSAGAQQREGSFYAGSLPRPEAPGTLVRTSPLTTPGGVRVSVPGARALRILYETRTSAGEASVSGGMAFIPDASPAASGRPVVAWAHPTRGPINVAPSRSAEPLQGMEPWLSLMLARGWVVVATDYSGLGTPGVQEYLNGDAEAGDVVDSVLAARQIRGAHAGTQWAAWGASYGGHAVLWTASLASSLAPALSLKGVAAAAPLAELVQLEHITGHALAAQVAAQDPPPPPPGVPILVLQGTNDKVVPAPITERLRSSWCAAGADLDVVLVPGATHESVVARTGRSVVSWLAARFVETHPMGSC